MWYQIFLIVIVLLLIYFWKQRYSYYLSWKLNGNLGYPLIGGLLDFKNQDDILEKLTKDEEKYISPYFQWMGPQCVIISSDPETMETILSSTKCVNKSFVYNFLTDLIGDGLFTSNVPVWNTRIKIIKPTFKRRMILGFYSIFNEQANELNQNIKENLNNNKDFSLFYFVQLAALKATFQTTLGDTHSEVEKIDFKKLLKSFSVIMEAMVERMFQPLYFEPRIYKLTQHYKRVASYRDSVYEFLDKKIRLKKETVEKTKSEENCYNLPDNDENADMRFKLPPSLLEYILVKNDHNLKLEEIRSEIVVLIAAGFETTAVGLYSALLCIAIHKEEQELLYEELCSVFPDKDFNVTEEHIKQLTYTEMCINESMRVISPVPVVGRVTMDNIKLKNGVILPKNTEILLDIFNLQRSKKYWGPNAKKFNPDNFHPDKIKEIHPYAYIPFTKGSRMCVGFRYSLTLMKIFIAKLFRNYKITTDMKFDDLQFVENISIKIKNHPTFTFEERQE